MLFLMLMIVLFCKMIRIIYEWASGNNMFFNGQTFQYICFNHRTSLSCNVDTSSSLEEIGSIYIYLSTVPVGI